ncbi:MAG: carbonic anhydrase [Bacteroides sp.]|nr:carbonic anhydrase [Bacteroides sp.]
MNKFSLYATGLLISVWLLAGTSSCTSKSENASVQHSTQSTITESDDPLLALKEGNQRFVSGKALHIHQDMKTVKELKEGQDPKAVIIGCSDSRVSPEILFDQGMGDLFVIRTAGNVMSDYELGSIEYATEHLHTKLVVVLGHYGCGAIHAMLEHKDDNDVPGHIAHIVNCLKEEEEEQEVFKSSDNISVDAVKANVIHGVKMLRECDPILKEEFKKGKVQIVGAVYHLDNGQVDFLEI